MKTSSFPHSLLQISLRFAVCGGFSLLPLAAEEEPGKHHDGIIEKSRHMQERMSKHFHDTWNGLRESVEGKTHSKSSLAVASLDVREQNDAYTVRLNLPGRDPGKVEINIVDGKNLQIKAPAEDKVGRYEQTLVLDGIATGAAPQIDRNPAKHLIIITIPKATEPSKPAPGPEASPPASLPEPSDRWDKNILEHMENMRREMDEMFHKSLGEMEKLPEEMNLFDQSQFGSSIEMREEDGKYIIRAYLPDRNAEKVNVSVENGNILKIDAVAEESTTKENGGTVLKHKSHYSQFLTLPGPVEADQLKVDRKQGMIVISVPVKSAG